MNEPSVPDNALIGEVRRLIDAACHRASLAVNAGSALLYWRVGRRIG